MEKPSLVWVGEIIVFGYGHQSWFSCCNKNGRGSGGMSEKTEEVVAQEGEVLLGWEWDEAGKPR